jgi:hypothetical protein
MERRFGAVTMAEVVAAFEAGVMHQSTDCPENAG